jgi:hypothetical protein
MGKRLRFMTGLIAPLKVEPGNLKALRLHLHELPDLLMWPRGRAASLAL